MRRTMPSVQNAWPDRTDRGERVERDRGRRAHRRDEPESGLRDVLDLPRAARGAPGREAAAREVAAALLLVARVAEHGDLHRAAVALGRVGARQRVALLLVQEAGDLREADDRVDDADRRRALAAPRERPELGIDLRRELREQAELLAAPRRLVGERLVADLLLDRHHVLHQHRVQRARVEEQHAALERRGRPALQARRGRRGRRRTTTPTRARA
jgi:hypothetical protein